MVASARLIFTLLLAAILHIPSDVRILTIPTVEAAQYVPDFTSTTTTADYVRYAAHEFGADSDFLLKTLICESNLYPGAIGDYGTSFGIAQIHLSAHPDITKAQALDPKFSIDYAAQQFATGNSSMWTCARE